MSPNTSPPKQVFTVATAVAADSGDDHETMINNNNNNNSSEFQFWKEAGLLFHVGLPSVLMQLSLYWIFPVSASYVGRELGSIQLGGFSLGCLVGNLTCLSIMEGSLTAADTLMPRAFGAQRYEEVGRLAVRSFFVGTLLLCIPVIPLCLGSSWILQVFGQEKQVSDLAQSWVRIYLIGAPANLVFRVLMRFLLSQHQPWPLVIASVLPSTLIHPILLEKYFIPMFGFQGSALSIVVTQWITLFLLLLILWIKPAHEQETWPGLSRRFIQGSLKLKPVWHFSKLAIGGILSMNEWWFFEIMCFIAGSFGVESLDAHTIAYNLVPLLFMLPLGVSIGLSVRMGNMIAVNPHKARKLAAWCMAFIAVVGLTVSTILYFLRLNIIRLFTVDVVVIDLALGIWPFLCIYMFLIYVMGISLAILRALGMQWRAAGIISASLYGMTLPAVVYFAIYKKGGLEIQWRVLPACYTILQLFLATGYLVLDWDAHAKHVRESIACMAMASPMRSMVQREVMDDMDAADAAGEETPLLV